MTRRHAASGSPFEASIGFSRAVRAGSTVAVSGTAPVWPDGSVDPDPAVQARRCFEIALAALAELGGRPEHVVRTRQYVVSADDAEAVGAVHGEVFGDVLPASTMVVVAALLDPRWKYEVELDAILDWSTDPRAVILVEGASDQRAVEVLARRRGRDLAAEGVAVVSMSGITNLSHHLDALPPGVLVAGLYDRDEEAWVQRALARRDVQVSLRVCDADLEDELIRALGVPACVEVIDGQGDSDAWATLLNQPFHRRRPQADVLHRFLGTTSGRKIEYAGLLTATACDRDCVPEPLDAVLADVR